jgi:dipeptidyl aminopeptidase/acylaminoacyl peptidase
MQELARTDIRRFLNVRSAYWPSFAADGQSIAFLSNITGTPQVWRVPIGGGWPEQVTFYSEAVRLVEHHPIDPRLVFAMDRGGSEKTQIYLATPDGSEIIDLSGAPDAIHQWGGWSHDAGMIAYSANREEPGRFDVYVQDLAHRGDLARLLKRGPGGYYMAGDFSPDDRQLLVAEEPSNTNQYLHLLDVDTGDTRPLTPHDGQVRFQQARWSPDGKAVYVLSDRGRDFLGLARIDLATGAMQFVEQAQWDIESFALSPDGRWLVCITNEEGASRVRLRPLGPGGRQRTLELPLGVVEHAGFSPDSRLVAFDLNGPRHNHDVWVCEVPSGTVRPVTRSSRAGISREAFVAPELVRYASFDGLSIPAWLYMPPVAPAGRKPPVIVYPHGGPESQTRTNFNPVFAYFLNRGYAVFAPNVRGSSGYGTQFMNMDNVRKRMDSVKDLAHGAFWLRDSGRVDGQRMAIYGGSYGGFMVLAAITNYPDLYAAAVDAVGIANWVTFLQHTGAYRRAAREAEYGSLTHDREFLESISPLRHVDKIRTPLMVIHGANDPRVPVGEAEQIVAALKRRNVPVEYLRYEDEGHGLVKLANRLDAYPRMAAFLDRRLMPANPHGPGPS